MQQMELRELLAEIPHAADPDAVIDDAERQIRAQKKQLLANLSGALGGNSHEQDLAAADIIRKLKFFFKLEQELEFIAQQTQD